MHVLLSGIVGSTAYGLAHAGSDTDRLGIFAAPTAQLHGLHGPKESQVTTGPDATHHEARKWCRLALGCNPTVTELVWLDRYEVRTTLGEELIGLRTRLLSARRVRDAYLGYATRQFKRLQDRGNGSCSARTRTTKHARHLVRLLEQGIELHRTGHLTIRLADPDRIRALGERIADDPDHARHLLARAEEQFDARGVLPEQPDGNAVEDWLHRVRAAYYTPPGVTP
ncbi:nucleotidyltransferase domain-containing protein [Streptomyces sp. JJ36]|uniref:nucleotidyltransferase domain-containing protein n=1 Tax=Streptomyces sp. JJ36 TaxID=2736645 RepID=UPI001F3423BA|nr:nucleotidyltransferase domain-containing protein [Streptomyces sp. JJ36]MCF6526188.1 nucleotidyltransferase domain-containing protein [Streptomyces sp. JJ36]